MPNASITFKHRMEYFAVTSLERLFRLLPYHAAILFATLLAWLAFNVFRFRRKEALRRIQSVFPEKSKREMRNIAWISLRNTVLNAAEIMNLGNISIRWIKKHYNADYMDVINSMKTILASGHGIVLALPHFGNWDLAGSVAAVHGIPIFAIAGKQKNPLTNEWLNHKRVVGVTKLQRGSSEIRQCIKRLRNNEVMATLPDVRMKTPDIKVKFLGGEANVGRGIAAFARQTDSPILLVKLRRIGLFNHEMSLSLPIWPDRTLSTQEDVLRITSTIMTHIDKQIRNEPGQWFWYNKRWILEPL